ncbi:hypothetical protein jhhlp_000856 [Lomentospora prolificans]|uniref:Major facilitator superfamily (MFS) profile domain-containing protein n=1 Tax=Lomentospora prolificans TaxID=41688 RepID=A0A2N3NJR1_9PEZI|nr:hypothetical protein jhhlp_000856 [Lomentospora prolificans]
MADDKQEKIGGYDAPGQQSIATGTDVEWLEEEEKRARRKVDSSVLPLLFLGLFVFQLDRMNLASALTDGFAKDIGVDQSTINLGNQLMFMGIVVFEIPCNMLLQKFGPRKWIPGQVILFGVVATLQIFVKSKTGFVVARMMLGFAEAGYIPGAAYTLGTWYKKRELAKRIAIFFFGMFAGNAISPILASGILLLGGKRGIKGWQWLFLIEGIFTISVGALLLFVLPGSPDTLRPLLSPGIIKFTEGDQRILQLRLELDDKEKRQGAQGMDIPWKIVWKTVSHYRRWPHFVSTFAVFSTWSPLTTYTPSIIMALGFNRTEANALSAVGASLALVVVFIFAWISDRTNKRGFSVIGAHACYIITLIVARSVHPHAGKWSRWGLWTAVNTFAVGYHPIHNSWVQLNCRDPRERSISVAMWVMSAISGLMVGTQYFRGNDLPFYDIGLRTLIIMVAVGMLFAAIQVIVYVVHNKRVAEGKHQPKDGEESMIYIP